ncbi:hypothetical protein ACQKJ1_25175 [Methylorubrum rhodesianum]|uniref:hypothetical protein n=1 Tax=Methylorubrum rhodesianum TaxID=29427 RepID=UPI003D085DBA
MIPDHVEPTPAADIALALSDPHGHLFLGMAGYVLHIGKRHTLTGYDAEEVFGEALTRGLAVVDARRVPEFVQIDLAFAAPRDETPHAKAVRYAAAGARLANLPDIHGSYGGSRDYARMSQDRAKDYAGIVEKARATRGGHLWIGPYGSTLYYGDARHSGFDPEAIKIAALAGGLPVIDTRSMDPATACRLVCSAPQVAVNRDPDPNPDCLGYASLRAVADLFRRAGAEVLNIDLAEEV